MTSRSLQLLEQLLVENELTEEELEKLVARKVREDLYLEYKHGNELLKSDASDTIREYTSGFANSAGGVLIVGVDAPDGMPTQIIGCTDHKKGDLAEWAARCLTPIASYFSPLPRFHVIHHSLGDVLVGVVQRSLGLVPRAEAGEMVYHFRLHDQTLKAPGYLLADLVLGRRKHPILDIIHYSANSLQRINLDGRSIMDLHLSISLQFENMSIIWSEEVRWGVIAWVKQIGSDGLQVSRPTNHLLSSIKVHQISKELYPGEKQLVHFRDAIGIEKPFEGDSRNVTFTLPLRIYQQWFHYTFKAAMYLIAKDSLPIWFQISIIIDGDIVKFIDGQRYIDQTSGKIRVAKLASERPVVSWEGL